MSTSNRQQKAFFPKADAAVLQTAHETPRTRPQEVAPVFDTQHVNEPILSWSLDAEHSFYPPLLEDYAPASIPVQPTCLADEYLYPVLTRDERLRLTMLWYYTRDILDDTELLSRLQEKTHLAQQSIGWEFVIIGLLDLNTYTRLATYGLPLAILPRRESTCAHTVNQPPGSCADLPKTVFCLLNMRSDWRFQKSPHVDIGGLRAYAGTPLRFRTESSDYIAFGSFCVASNTEQKPLTQAQYATLQTLADWAVADIVHSARARRQRERRQMAELISTAQKRAEEELSGDPVMNILETIYPHATISLQSSETLEISIEGREDSVLFSDLAGGLWEDSQYLDDFIHYSNHKQLPTDRAVRLIASRCESAAVPSFLVVVSRDIRLVFDDVDFWFVGACGGILSRVWQKRLLTEALKVREGYLRGITHQLRTPIHGILGSAELLLEVFNSRHLIEKEGTVDRDPTSPDLTVVEEHTDPRAYLNVIQKSGRDLIAVVNSMITLNRWADIALIERHDSLHTLQELERELLREISKAISLDINHTPSIFYIHQVPTCCNCIWMDFNLLKNTLLPLLQNAIQHASDGIIIITMSISPDYKELNMDIEDTGCGIHPDHQKKVFNAFEKAFTHSTGAGLGLTLASKYATLLGGSVILVSSELNRGSHFRANVPNLTCACSLPPDQPLDLTPKWETLPATFYHSTSCSDSPQLCDYFARILISYGFTSSEDPQNSFIIIDFISDSKARSIQLGQLRPDQVAICLIPAPESAEEFDDSHKNVVYVRGPFLDSTLSAALERADAILSEMKISNANLSSQNISSITLPIRETVVDSERDKSRTISETSVSYPETTKTADAGISSTLSHQVIKGAVVVSEIPIQISPAITTDSSNPTVLLVDDNAVNLRIMQMYCSKRGLPFHCASDGCQAVEIFRQQQLSSAPIELVLMDLQMPVCDGLEATRQIRLLEKENNWRRSVLFIVTGQDSPSDRVDAEDVGADGYFVKPVGIKSLDHGVKRFFPSFKSR